MVVVVVVEVWGDKQGMFGVGMGVGGVKKWGGEAASKHANENACQTPELSVTK